MLKNQLLLPSSLASFHGYTVWKIHCIVLLTIITNRLMRMLTNVEESVASSIKSGFIPWLHCLENSLYCLVNHYHQSVDAYVDKC